jgi:hypothetical protein
MTVAFYSFSSHFLPFALSLDFCAKPARKQNLLLPLLLLLPSTVE